MRASEEATGGHDVFAARGAQGTGEAVVVEVVLESFNIGFGGSLEGCPRRGMEADKIDTTIETFK